MAGARPRPRCAAEERIEDIAKAAESLEAGEALGSRTVLYAGVAEPIVGGALLSIAEDLVSLCCFLELFRGFRVIVTVRMILQRLLAKRLFDVL